MIPTLNNDLLPGEPVQYCNPHRDLQQLPAQPPENCHLLVLPTAEAAEQAVRLRAQNDWGHLPAITCVNPLIDRTKFFVPSYARWGLTRQDIAAELCLRLGLDVSGRILPPIVAQPADNWSIRLSRQVITLCYSREATLAQWSIVCRAVNALVFPDEDRLWPVKPLQALACGAIPILPQEQPYNRLLRNFALVGREINAEEAVHRQDYRRAAVAGAREISDSGISSIERYTREWAAVRGLKTGLPHKSDKAPTRLV